MVPPKITRPAEDVDLTDEMVVRVMAVAASVITFFGAGDVGNTAIINRAKEVEKYILTGG